MYDFISLSALSLDEVLALTSKNGEKLLRDSRKPLYKNATFALLLIVDI